MLCKMLLLGHDAAALVLGEDLQSHTKIVHDGLQDPLRDGWQGVGQHGAQSFGLNQPALLKHRQRHRTTAHTITPISSKVPARVVRCKKQQPATRLVPCLHCIQLRADVWSLQMKAPHC